ncbi:hypothetical protein A3E42_03880 [Candidatus Gottesmanbacteria bacterium RIFCSPHIGHO2_12_FULL_40_13]|nr:MAG: hypothetical protein A3E42_03880 [Candidatus Gottesmanbacteria bacterium RIFCSPHIGHO2_12_FULL_40_13]
MANFNVRVTIVTEEETITSLRNMNDKRTEHGASLWVKSRLETCKIFTKVRFDPFLKLFGWIDNAWQKIAETWLTPVGVSTWTEEWEVNLEEYASSPPQDFKYMLTAEWPEGPVMPVQIIETIDAKYMDCAPAPIMGSISGQKTDQDGNPVPGVTIKLYRQNENGQFVKIDEMVTDANGNYRFDNLEVGVYKVAEVVPEGWEPIGPTESGELVIDGDHKEWTFNFQNRRIPVEVESACIATVGSVTWLKNDIVANGTIQGRNTNMWAIKLRGQGPPEDHPRNDPNVFDWGKGSSGSWSFTREWKNRSDFGDWYQGWVRTPDGEWITSPKCEFKPVGYCPNCPPEEHIEKQEPEKIQKVFFARACSVGYCNTITLPTEVLLRSTFDYQVPYKGETLQPIVIQTLVGPINKLLFDFTWVQDGNNFPIQDENGNPIRDTYGEDVVDSSISCSLTVGFWDLTPDLVAMYQAPQTVYNWQYAVIREWKLLDNSQVSWDQVGLWARELMKKGELPLSVINDFGEKQVDLSKLPAPTGQTSPTVVVANAQ